MRLFLDEAGNTGDIIDKNEKLNYGTQRHFCLAAVVAHDLQSEQLLRQKYAAFKNRFASEKELKGNSLFAKENNDALEYFLKFFGRFDNHFAQPKGVESHFQTPLTLFQAESHYP